MPASDILVRQHRKVQEVMGEIRTRLRPEAAAADAALLASLVTQLNGALSTHLAMEDKVLYPKLLGATASDVRQAGARYAEQMGGISPRVREFSSRWCEAKAIAAATGDFISAAEALLLSLSSRMELEERELYPMFDTL